MSSEPYEVTSDLVYLTADSPNTITELENGKKYIVGAIVDKNRHKGLCHKKAAAQGVATAKLPIGEYVSMASRFVLTTNQVVEIMIRWLECRDWERAFLEVIPKRKMPVAKGGGEDGEDGEGEGEQEGDMMPVEDGYNYPAPLNNLDKAGGELGETEDAVLIDGEQGEIEDAVLIDGELGETEDAVLTDGELSEMGSAVLIGDELGETEDAVLIDGELGEIEDAVLIDGERDSQLKNITSGQAPRATDNPT